MGCFLLKKMPKFAIVEFLDEKSQNEIEVVPINWLIKIEDDNFCWWPSAKGQKLNKMLTDENSVVDMNPGMGSIYRAKILKYYGKLIQMY